MSDLDDMVREYMQNSEEIIAGLQKEASEYKARAEAAERKQMLEKEAAGAAAASLLSRGLISANSLSQTIDDLCADPLGVITQLSKTAAQQPAVPSMGAGSKRSGKGVFSTEKLSNADRALLSHLRLI